MIEVFKTDVSDGRYARIIIEEIQMTFPYYEVNFDLQDCDKILRVKNTCGDVNSGLLINFVNNLGFHAEVLSDNFPAMRKMAGVNYI